MKKTNMLLAAAASLIISSAAFAADPPKFAGADANGDGGVDKAEFDALGLDKEFFKFDKDENGKLSKDEYAASLEEECE